MTNKKEWTMKEINFLIENAEDMTQEEFAERLGRTQKSVRMQAYRLGLDILTDSKFNLYKQEYVLYNKEDVIAMGTIAEIAEKIGKKFSTVAKWRFPVIQQRMNYKLIMAD